MFTFAYYLINKTIRMRLLVLFVAIMLFGVQPVDAQKKKKGKSEPPTEQEYYWTKERLDSFYNAASLRFEQKKQVYAKQDSAFWADLKIVDSNGMEVIADKKPRDTQFDIVESMPTFPGGEGKLMEWLNSHVKYPALAEEQGIQGRVIMRFVVAPDGSIRDVSVKRSVDLLLDMEAYRVIRAMPKWIPGVQNDKPVPVWFVLPVTFQLR